MSVLINFKICDNSKDCSGIEVCPTKALSWDEKKKSIAIDNGKCISCGKCETACPIDAIKVAKTESEYKKIKLEIDSDPRRVSDLFVDRYGAVSVSPAFLIPKERFDVQMLESTKLAAAEFFSSKSIRCLLNSITVKDLIGDMDVKYRKIMLKEDDELAKKYNVKELPAMLFFKNGKLIGKVEGYYSVGQTEEMKKKIRNIVKQ